MSCHFPKSIPGSLKCLYLGWFFLVSGIHSPQCFEGVSLHKQLTGLKRVLYLRYKSSEVGSLLAFLLQIVVHFKFLSLFQD